MHSFGTDGVRVRVGRVGERASKVRKERQRIGKKEDFKAVERRDRFMKRMQRLQPMQRLSVESAVRGDMRPMAKLPIDAFTAGADVFEIVEDTGVLLEQSGLLSGGTKGK